MSPDDLEIKRPEEKGDMPDLTVQDPPTGTPAADLEIRNAEEAGDTVAAIENGKAKEAQNFKTKLETISTETVREVIVQILNSSPSNSDAEKLVATGVGDEIKIEGKMQTGSRHKKWSTDVYVTIKTNSEKNGLIATCESKMIGNGFTRGPNIPINKLLEEFSPALVSEIEKTHGGKIQNMYIAQGELEVTLSVPQETPATEPASATPAPEQIAATPEKSEVEKRAKTLMETTVQMLVNAKTELAAGNTVRAKYLYEQSMNLGKGDAELKNFFSGEVPSDIQTLVDMAKKESEALEVDLAKKAEVVEPAPAEITPSAVIENKELEERMVEVLRQMKNRELRALELLQSGEVEKANEFHKQNLDIKEKNEPPQLFTKGRKVPDYIDRLHNDWTQLSLTFEHLYKEGLDKEADAEVERQEKEAEAVKLRAEAAAGERSKAVAIERLREVIERCQRRLEENRIAREQDNALIASLKKELEEIGHENTAESDDAEFEKTVESLPEDVRKVVQDQLEKLNEKIKFFEKKGMTKLRDLAKEEKNSLVLDPIAFFTKQKDAREESYTSWLTNFGSIHSGDTLKWSDDNNKREMAEIQQIIDAFKKLENK